MIKFCFDRYSTKTIHSSKQIYKKNIIYPNLVAPFDGELYDMNGKFASTYPYSDPPRLIEYLDTFDIPYELYDTSNNPPDSFYYININFFSYDVDWFAQMSPDTLLKAQQNKFKLLFFYCEGDSPYKIRDVLFSQAKLHQIDINQIHFISHSSIADQVKNFYYFNDDEILFFNAQEYSKAQALWHNKPRSKKFTLLMRSHKNWRMMVASDFYEKKYHKFSYFSYNTIDLSDGFNHAEDFIRKTQNPLWTEENNLSKFRDVIPISADNLSDDEHNNYETFVEKFYTNAYWNIVCETHLNLDGTTGTFLTEKTWKPIRHNQPFIIIGTIGSLNHLQKLGYKTFDGIIDEHYDYIKDDKLRYNAICDVIDYLASRTQEELQEINQQVKPIVEHNSTLFNASKKHRLEELVNKLLSAS